MARRPLIVPLLLGLALPLAAQETQPLRLAKLRQQLEQRPGHAAVFEAYFKALVAANAVEAEITLLEDRLHKDAGETTLSLILGRLLLRANQEDKALLVLDGIATKTPEVQGVLGEIYHKLGRHDAAARAFTAALPAATTSEAKSKLYERIGRAQLALNQKAQALATWQQIAELDGGKFHRRLQVAELLTEAGLLAEAEQAYAPLLVAAESDPAQLCKVMRDQGRLQELQGQLDTALATYDAILGKTARGNWLRKEIEGRVVQIHRRQGRLDALVLRLQEQRQQSPDDLSITELLADVLVEMRKLGEAAQLLAAATPKHPGDVRLARRLAQLHVDQGQIEPAIAEYQRIVSVKPDELEIYLELGQLFAKGEKLEEAKNQWEKVLARNLKDASLCTRIASMYALYEREADAIRLYERAIEIEPDAMVRHTDLAEYQFARGKKEAGTNTLLRAMQAAQGKPRRLEAIVGALREHELIAAAQSCLEQILQAEPGNQETRYALADLLLGKGETEAAKGLLWQVVEAEEAQGGSQRTQAANTLVQLAIKEDKQAELIALAEHKQSPGAAFVLGRAHTRSRDFEKAIASYRQALTRKSDDVEARRLLARLLSEEGDFQGALREYATIEQLQPSEGKRQFREVARLHLETYDLEQAIAVWQKAMRDNPDNASVFVEVGKEFLNIQRVQEALEAFAQAARLKASDPDIQLRLADALRQAGKPEEAEKQLYQVATSALDGRDREQARAKLFELCAEQGLIDKRIEALATTVAESPYDKDAPQLLADLYMRTGDYVLGLEMVEKAIGFQPRNKELLTRKAELFEALEEWDRAKLAHEELLKFPDAERDVHLAGIGQALYESGRATEAKGVFEKIVDRGRVASLYKKYELHDEAIEFYKRAISRNPADLKSYVDLAEQLVERNRQQEAIGSLERALNLNPFHRRSLELVGKLYVQQGRRDDAVKAGMRLFGLRGEETAKTREEELEQDRQRGRSRGSYYDPFRFGFNQQRLQAAQSYFQERGLEDEWGRILVAEAKRRLADLTLFQEVRNHFSWRDKSAKKLIEFLRELLARDFTKVRIPPGYTERSYREQIEQALFSTYQQDASLAESRICELAGDNRTPTEAVERAKLRFGLGKLAEAEAEVRALVQREPQDIVALLLLVELVAEKKAYAEAAELVGRVIAWCEGPGKEYLAERAARDRVAFQTARKGMLDQLPRKLRRKVDDEQLFALHTEVRPTGFSGKLSTISFPETAPSAFAARLKRIRLLHAAGDLAGMDAATAEARGVATELYQQLALGKTLYEEDRKAEAEPLLAAVLAAEPGYRADPVRMYFWDRYRSLFGDAANVLGELLAAKGKPVEAYALLRDHAQGQKAELILRQSGKGAEILQVLSDAVAKSGQRLREARNQGAADLTNVEFDYRDDVIKLADFHIGEKDFARVDAVYQESLALLPDDLEIRNVLAGLRLRQGDAARAVATHEEILDVKRRKKRTQQVEQATPPARLQPTLPDSGNQDRSSSFGGMFGGPVAYTGPYYGSQSNLDVASTYLQILRIYTDRRDVDGVLRALRKIAQEDPAAFRNFAYQVVETLRNQDLGKKKLPILRMLRGVVTNNPWLALEYAKACSEESELKEAERVLDNLVAKSTSPDDYYTQEAQRELDRIAQKQGQSKIPIEELRKAVEREPDNVRHRMKLAERLKKEHRYDETLAEVEAIVKKAPYMAKAKEMVVDASAAVGKDETAIAMMRRLFEESSSTYDKLRRGVNLANWLHAQGLRDEAYAIVDGLETQSGGSNNFSPGNWFLDKHELERAQRLIAKDFEKKKTQQYEAQVLRQRLARLDLASGREKEGIARHLEALREATALNDREQRFKELLLVCKNHPDPARLGKALVAHEARATVEDRLVCAAVAFAKGEAAAAEKDLRTAVQLSPKEVYLYPLLYGLRRLAGDLEGAIGVLDEMARVYGGSETMRYSGAGVSLNERDRLKLERAGLLEELGKRDEALALIDSLFDETKPETMTLLASVYRDRREFAKALEWRRRFAQKTGQKNAVLLREEAGLLLELDKFDEALAVLAEADLMSRGDTATRQLLIKVHRRKGTLAEYVATLEADYAKDPRNQGVRALLLELYDEQRRPDAKRRIFLQMLTDPPTKAQALEGLVALAQRDRDRKAVVEHLRALVDMKGGEEKKQAWGRLAGAQLEADDAAGAEVSMKNSVDLGTADGWQQLGWWYFGQKREADALAAFRKVVELDPDRDWELDRFVTAAWQNHQHQEVISRMLEGLRKKRGKVEALDIHQRTQLLDALSGLSAAERAALIAPDGADVDALERAGVLRFAQGDVKEAERLFREVVRMDPKRFVAWQHLRAILRQQDRAKELLPVVEKLRDLVEREYVIRNDWSLSNMATNLQDQIGCLHHELGDDQKAAEAWRTAALRRTPYSQPYGYWRSDWQVRYAAEKWLTVGRPELALACYQTEFLQREAPPWSGYMRALEASGQHSQVEAMAWKRLTDPLELYGVITEYQSWYWDEFTGESRPSSGAAQFLASFYWRQGRLDELYARLAELEQNPAHKPRVEEVRTALFALARDRGQIAQVAEARLTEDDQSVHLRFGAAQAWLRAGDAGKALEHLRHVLDFESKALRHASRAPRAETYRQYTYVNGQRVSGRQKNPFSFTFSGDSWSSSYWSSGWERDLDTYRRTAAAALLAKGQRDLALEIEEDLVGAALPSQRDETLSQIASDYQRYELWPEVVRVRRMLLDRKDMQLEPGSRVQQLQMLLAAVWHLGDPAVLRSAQQELRTAIDQQIAAAPGPHALGVKQGLLAFLVDELRDAAGATRIAAELESFGIDCATYRARILVLEGKAKEAVAAYRQLEERARVRGAAQDSPETRIPLGLALAAAGESEEAKRILGPASRMVHDERVKAEVMEALAKLGG